MIRRFSNHLFGIGWAGLLIIALLCVALAGCGGSFPIDVSWLNRAERLQAKLESSRERIDEIQDRIGRLELAGVRQCVDQARNEAALALCLLSVLNANEDEAGEPVEGDGAASDFPVFK